jgi:hypothetical protein
VNGHRESVGVGCGLSAGVFCVARLWLVLTAQATPRIT